MNSILATVFAGAIVGAVAGCGGGEGTNPRPPDPPSQDYGGVAAGWVARGSCNAVAAITTDYSSESSAETAALGLCQSAGATCKSSSFGGCVAVAAGIEAQADASGTRDCKLVTRNTSSVGVARSDALQACRSSLGSGAQCNVVNSGCASYSVSPGIGRWSPPQDPPEPPNNTQNLRNVNVTIPSSCPREVEVCVRDHQCEDGDQVRVSVNNRVIFSGELFNAWKCRRVPVQTGNNSIQMFAINGTGYKGNCDHSDANTGEIRVRGGSNSNTQSWRHAGGTGSSAWINVNIGPAGGNCTPGTLPVQSRLYGAVASSLENNCRSQYFAISANHSSDTRASSAALSGCQNKGGSACSVDATFGSAYAGNHQCGALAFGETSTRCRLRAGTGNTASAAESVALSRCRSGGFSCSLVRGDRGRFATCTQ